MPRQKPSQSRLSIGKDDNGQDRAKTQERDYGDVAEGKCQESDSKAQAKHQERNPDLFSKSLQVGPFPFFGPAEHS